MPSFRDTASERGKNPCLKRPPFERPAVTEGKPMRLATGFGALGALVVLAANAATAAEMRGVTATEIKIGQTMPYSGPVSAFGALGKGEVGYFKMLNERGGINGRKVNLISLDDGYAPPKAVEQTRRLVESDEVALIFSTDRHRAEHRDRQISAEQEHPATVPGLRRLEIRRHRAISASHRRRAGAVPLRGAALRPLRAFEKPQRQIRRDLAERRLRPRLSARPEGRARRQIRFRRDVRDL